MRVRNIQHAVSILALISSGAVAHVAQAQAVQAPAPEAQTEADQTAESEAPGSEIVVTGSRTATNVSTSPTPLTTATMEQLVATTPASLPEGLKKLPVFQGSTGQRSMVGGGQDSGTSNTLNLRAFGASRTLVLFDGHRVTPTGTDGTINVDALPQLLISRVDVVTGGASAVYGSDAVTGVVNFILDKKFSGIKSTASYGISQDGEGEEKQFAIAGGTSFADNRGHVLVSARYYDQDPVRNLDLHYGPQIWSQSGSGLTADNPLLQTRDTRATFATFGGLVNYCGEGCVANGQQFVSPGVLGPFVSGKPLLSTGNQSGGSGGYLTHNTAVAGLRTYDLFGRLSYDLSPSTSAYVNVSWSKTRNQSVYSDTLFVGMPTTYFKDNPFLPDATRAALATGTGNTFIMNKFNPEVPGTIIHGQNTNFNVTAGLQGSLFERLDWDLFYTHGSNRRTTEVEGNVNNMRILAAQDAVINSANGQVVCQVSLTQYAGRFPGCVPFNPFGPNTVTLEQRAYATDTTAWFLSQHLDNVGGSIAGDAFDLPAGPVKVALSGEARWQDLKVTNRFDPTSAVDCSGLRLCNPAAPPSFWSGTIVQNVPRISSNVWELAAEANIPLLRDQAIFRDLSVNVAGRYTNYSTSGSVKTWKIGLNWAIDDNIRFRGTASRDIRAPSLFDLSGPVNRFARTFEDNHVLDASGNPTSYDVIAETGSNPDLVPEVARTYTAGIVITPTAIPNLSLAVDWYRIRMNNAISFIGGNDAAVKNLCEASNGAHPVCDLYVRPLPFSDRSLANRATIVRSVALNSASTTLEGIDAEFSYRFDGSAISSSIPGAFSIRALGSLSIKNESQAFAGQPKSYAAGSRKVATVFLNYNVGDWAISVQDSWRSSFRPNTDDTTIYFSPAKVASSNTVDLSVTKTFNIGKASADVFVNVQNVFNNHGPLYAQFGLWGFFYPVPNTQYGNATFGNYPILGRFFTVGVRTKM